MPLLVHTTYLGDTRPLVDAIVGYRRGLDAGISFGMRLSVMCSECGDNFIAAFIAAASAQGVDFSCKDRVQLPPFAIGVQ